MHEIGIDEAKWSFGRALILEEERSEEFLLWEIHNFDSNSYLPNSNDVQKVAKC